MLISQKTLFEVADRKDISEEDFCKMGQVLNKKKDNEWSKNIMNFTEETKKLNKRQYESFKNVFQKIHQKCVEYDINDLTKFFEESDINIEPDGDIEFKDFKDAMMNIGVSYNVQLDTLINRFKNKKKSPREMMKLVEFLSIYNLFKDEDNEDLKESDKESKIDKDKESDNKQYAYKNAHRKFTQEDIDYISEICQGLAEIIIDELHDSVTNFFQKKDRNKQGYITFNDFKDILNRDLKIDYKSDIENFQVFFDFVLSDKMIEGEDIIETKKIINIIISYSGRDKPDNFGNDEEEDNTKINDININNNNKKGILFQEEEDLKGTNAPNLNNKNITNVKLEQQENESETENNKMPIEMINTQITQGEVSFDKIISEFAHYLFTNKKRFSSIFPSISLEKIINNQTITAETLKLGFQRASYPISDKEFSIVMTHFDPINKEKVNVEDLKHEIEKYAPLYFKQSFQKIDSEEIEKKLKQKGRELELSASTNFGKRAFNANLLNGMNKIKTFLDRKKLPVDNFFLGQFKEDAKNENSTINEETWENSFLSQQKDKDRNKSFTIPNLTKPEIDAIYKAVDIRSNDSVTLNEIISFFNKYIKKKDNLINKDDQTSLNEYIKNELKSLFDNFDTNKNDTILFEDFYKCLKSVDHKATKYDAQTIIAEYTKKNPSTIDRGTFNEIMFNYIQKELVIQKQEKDYIKNLFKEIDIDNNGFLTRNQIKYLIKNKIGCNLTDAELEEILDKVDIKQENEIDIREFIYLLDNIDSPQKNNQIENSINSKPNQEEELIPIMNLNLNLNMHRKMKPKDFISLYSGKRLSPYEPRINCKIYFDDYATGVSSPDETLFESPNSQFKVVGRLLKICLYNNRYKIFVGNAISIDCIYKKEYQDRWYFETSDSNYNNNIIIRYNEPDIMNIDVVFEFVLVIQKKVEQTLYTVETSCGWCKIPMVDLQLPRSQKLPIKGGSPLSVGEISQFDIRKKRTGFIPKLATLFEGQINSECPIRKIY